MKKIYLLAFGLLATVSSIAQKSPAVDNVGIGTKYPDRSAVLDIQSVDKGLLIPRLTSAQRNAIKNPADGLMVYQINEISGFYFYNGKNWAPLSGNEAKSIALDIQNWSKTGDAGTNPTTNFLGTTDNQPLVFRTNNKRSGFISGEGSVGQFNTMIGFESGISMTTGNSNLGFGVSALRLNSEGYSNVELGSNSLESNTTGFLNAGLGASSLGANISGSGNLAIGGGALRLNQDGHNNIGIGKFSLYNNVSGSGNIAIGKEAGFFETGDNKLYISSSATITPLIYGDFSAKYVTIGDVSPTLRNQGTATGGYNLLVKGGILTEKVKVALAQPGTDWADYVFEPEYKSKMMSLEEVEKFTLKNKHLPNVPSADDMVKNGLDVSQTSKMFMEKIEELTLYMIELNKEVKALKAENEALKVKK
jgi:hypothetical protein